MATIPSCDEYAGQSVISTTAYGALCVEPAAPQNQFVFYLPSVATWFKDNWYVIFIVALVVVLCVVAIALQCIRWSRRLRHRHERELRDKRVGGLLRMVSTSFRVPAASSAAQPPTSKNDRDTSVKSRSTTTTTTTSSLSSSDDDDDSSSRSFSESNSGVEAADLSNRGHRHHPN
ncbi:unspecified product [Leptomonas pyrrhocoris]|uniref:Unspecified product n=1 Tax=Leptomonas pyrrhocoris TaxID=157538 RepID=A0A0M9FUK9_LEPPY|nr:unspecified product [Leptomonas pyrrhocoris]KPA76400.1 unspecified product [Leptomonas pyrrhocoris]|eukprot:XP_015654839.1 unspecified product [Leptomonas pyrrhocoris]